jgi:hypothetical protein
MMLEYLTYASLAVIVLLFLASAIRILREYERGVIFTLGRFTGVKGPGLIILIPVVQQMVKADLRVMVQVVPPQDVISGNSRSADRRLGHQGYHHRDQGYRSQRNHGAGDCQAGRGGAVATCEGDQCDGRAAGRREACRGRPNACAGAAGDAVALLRGAARHCRRAVLNRGLSAADRFAWPSTRTPERSNMTWGRCRQASP